jgi:hypothetical protein
MIHFDSVLIYNPRPKLSPGGVVPADAEVPNGHRDLRSDLSHRLRFSESCLISDGVTISYRSNLWFGAEDRKQTTVSQSVRSLQVRKKSLRVLDRSLIATQNFLQLRSGYFELRPP